MKRLKSIFITLLIIVLLFAPLTILTIGLLTMKEDMITLGSIGLVLFIILLKPLKTMMQKADQDADYDEFGRSRKKSDFKKLSRKERDIIDFQKAADMERILPQPLIRRMQKSGSKNPMKELRGLIGLGSVKEKVEEIAARMEFERSHKQNKQKLSESGRHMVFFGSPGTGKTTVARIMAGILYQNGIIKKNQVFECDGNFLKAGVDTAVKTQYIVQCAMGSVLFIDEAYALMTGTDGTGEAAIATLIKMMEDYRGRFVLILAGYTDEMKELISLNPGFASRIKEYLVFPDYNSSEMREIFIKMAGEHNLAVSAEALDTFEIRIANERKLNSFGNGRTVRNVLDEAIDKHALHIKKGTIDKADRFILQDVDVPTRPKTFI
jgi:stage V sporulation protein K